MSVPHYAKVPMHQHVARVCTACLARGVVMHQISISTADVGFGIDNFNHQHGDSTKIQSISQKSAGSMNIYLQSDQHCYAAMLHDKFII